MQHQSTAFIHKDAKGAHPFVNLPQKVGSESPTSKTGNCLTQISAGPAALLYSIMGQIVALYNMIQGKASQYSQEEVAVQAKTATASANESLTAANSQAKSLSWQAAQSIAGAVTGGVNLGAQGAMFAQGFGKMGEHEEIASNQEKLLQMERDPAKAINVGAPPSEGEGEINKEKVDEIDARKKSLLNDFGGSKYSYQGDNYPKTEAYIHTGKKSDEAQGSSLDQDAINSMSPDEYKTFKENVRKEIRSHREEVNGLRTDKQTKLNMVTTFADLVKETSGAVSAIGQRKATQQKGQAEAAQQEMQFASQSASASVQLTTEQMKQFFSKVGETIASLKQGAMAYAQ